MTLGIIITAVILLLGLACLAVAFSFMIKPSEVKLAFFRPLSVATTFASITGVVTGLAMTLSRIAWELEGGEKTVGSAQFLGGLSEALVPSIIGFALLAVAWVALALGMRRHI